MAATVAKLDARRGGQRPAETGGPTVRAAIDTFLDSPDVRANPNTLRAYTSVLDRVGGEIGTSRRLAEVLDDEIASALTGLWGGAKPATWNRNRAAVGSWLAWCAGKQHWTAPVLPAAAQRRRQKAWNSYSYGGPPTHDLTRVYESTQLYRWVTRQSPGRSPYLLPARMPQLVQVHAEPDR